MKSIWFLAIPFWSLSFNVSADYWVEFIRVACIPETGFFELEYKAVPSGTVFSSIVLNAKEEKKELDLWRKHGFFNPASMVYECKLASASYVISATKPGGRDTGMCGGAPAITMSLTREGEAWVDGATFGPNCLGVPAISKISVEERERRMTACVVDGEGDAEYCSVVDGASGAISNAIPITPDKVSSCVSQRGANKCFQPTVPASGAHGG